MSGLDMSGPEAIAQALQLVKAAKRCDIAAMARIWKDSGAQAADLSLVQMLNALEMEGCKVDLASESCVCETPGGSETVKAQQGGLQRIVSGRQRPVTTEKPMTTPCDARMSGLGATLVSGVAAGAGAGIGSALAIQIVGMLKDKKKRRVPATIVVPVSTSPDPRFLDEIERQLTKTGILRQPLSDIDRAIATKLDSEAVGWLTSFITVRARREFRRTGSRAVESLEARADFWLGESGKVSRGSSWPSGARSELSRIVRDAERLLTNGVPLEDKFRDLGSRHAKGSKAQRLSAKTIILVGALKATSSQRLQTCAVLGQPIAGPIPTVEVGFPICRTSVGKLARNVPQVSGTPTSVSVPIACPTGSSFVGIAHTHPGGVPLPSATDRASGKKFGAKTLCIRSDNEIRCHVP